MRNIFVLLVEVALIALLARVALGAPVETPLDLRTALETALRGNPDYRTAQTAAAAAQARLRQARVPLGPGVALSDTYQYATPTAALSTPFGTLPFQPNSTNVPLLSVDYLVSDGGATAARVGAAAATVASAQAAEREARAAVTQRVTLAYYELVAALRAADVAQGAVALADAHLTLAQRLLRAGQVPRAEVLQAQTDLAGRRFDAIQTRAKITQANVELDAAMNVPLSTLYRPTESLEGGAAALDLQSLVASGATSRSELVAARLAVDAARRALDAARAGRAPRVSVYASEGNVQPVVTSAFRAQFTVGLRAVWSVFDNGANAATVAEAEAGLERARIAVEAQATAVEAEIRNAYARFDAAKEQEAAAREMLALADENERLAEVRYRGAVGTSLEVRDAEQRVVAARQGLLEAQRTLRESVVSVRFAAGLL